MALGDAAMRSSVGDQPEEIRTTIAKSMIERMVNTVIDLNLSATEETLEIVKIVIVVASQTNLPIETIQLMIVAEKANRGLACHSST